MARSMTTKYIAWYFAQLQCTFTCVCVCDLVKICIYHVQRKHCVAKLHNHCNKCEQTKTTAIAILAAQKCLRQYVNSAPVKNVTSTNANTHTHMQSETQVRTRKSGAFQLDRGTNYELLIPERNFSCCCNMQYSQQTGQAQALVLSNCYSRSNRIDQISMAITVAQMGLMPFAFKTFCIDAFSVNVPMIQAEKTLTNKRKACTLNIRIAAIYRRSVRICLLFSKICHDSRLRFRCLLCLRRLPFNFYQQYLSSFALNRYRKYIIL